MGFAGVAGAVAAEKAGEFSERFPSRAKLMRLYRNLDENGRDLEKLTGEAMV